MEIFKRKLTVVLLAAAMVTMPAAGLPAGRSFAEDTDDHTETVAETAAKPGADETSDESGSDETSGTNEAFVVNTTLGTDVASGTDASAVKNGNGPDDVEDKAEADNTTNENSVKAAGSSRRAAAAPDAGTDDTSADPGDHRKTDTNVLKMTGPERSSKGVYSLNGQLYDSLAEVLKNLADGVINAVTVYSDKEETGSFSVNKQMTIRADEGTTLSIKGMLTVAQNAFLEICDGINIDGGKKAGVTNNGTLSIKGGRISGASVSSSLTGAVVNNAGAEITEISGDARIESDKRFGIMNKGVIHEISGGTISSAKGNAIQNADGRIDSISGGTITGDVGINIYNQKDREQESIGSITGGLIEGTGSHAININDNKWGENSSDDIGTITGGSIEACKKGYGINIRQGSIGTISGDSSISGGMGIYLYTDFGTPGRIGEISGNAVITGTHGDSGTGYALYNGENSTVNIYGGSFDGHAAGLYNKGVMNIYTAAPEAGSENKDASVIFVTGSEAVLNDFGTVTISGNGNMVFRGKGNGNKHVMQNAATDSANAFMIEDGITDIAGFGRYRSAHTIGDTSGGVLGGARYLPVIPEGYHVSVTRLRIPDQKDDLDYHFLVKDNTVIYNGNGCSLRDGEKDAGFFAERDMLHFENFGEGAERKAHDNGWFDPGDKVLAGWNTEPDLSGTEYKPGEVIDLTEGKDMMLYAHWVDKEPDKPAEPEVTEPEKPAESQITEPDEPAYTPSGTATVPGEAALAAPEEEYEGESVPDNEVPLAAPESADENSWALINLIAMILTFAGAVTAFIRRRDNSRTNAMNTCGAIAGIISVAAFMLTEDLSAAMVTADKWTIVMLALFAVQVIAAALAERFSTDTEEPEK